MNEQRLRELMNDSVGEIDASNALRARVSAAVGGIRARRRTAVRGWIAVGGAAVAAAAVLLAVPLIRSPDSAPPGPGGGALATPTGVTPVDDVEDVLGGDTWYGVGIVRQGLSLALSAPKRAEDAMRIKLDGNGLSGYDGCHWFYAGRPLLVSAPTNTVAITMTANACEPDPVGSKEFYAALSSGPKSWAIDAGFLVLDAEGIQIIFSKDRTARPRSSSAISSSESRSRATSSGSTGVQPPGISTPPLPVPGVVVSDPMEALGETRWYVTELVVDGMQSDLTALPALQLKVTGRFAVGVDGCNVFTSVTGGLRSGGWRQLSTSLCVQDLPIRQQFVSAVFGGKALWSLDDSGVIVTDQLRRTQLRLSTIPVPGTTILSDVVPSGGEHNPDLEPPKGLSNSLWRIRSTSRDGVRFGPPSAAQNAEEPAAYSIWFGTDTYRISDGCRTFTGRLSVDGLEVRFLDGIPAEIGACPGNSSVRQVIHDLARSPVVGLRLSSDHLRLGAGGMALELLRAPSADMLPPDIDQLVDKQWILREIRAVDGSVDVASTGWDRQSITFTTTGVRFSIGCNTSEGSVGYSGDQLRIGGGSMTLMACNDSGLPRAAMSLLAGPDVTWAIEGTQLSLSIGLTTLVFDPSA